VTADDKKSGKEELCLYTDGINVHVKGTPEEVAACKASYTGGHLRARRRA
jgi:hypothetical protein